MNIKQSIKFCMAILAFALCHYQNVLADSFEVDGIYYYVTSESNREVCVTYKQYGYQTDTYVNEVKIPSTVTYNGTTYTVISINDYAFKECTNLTSVLIPNSVQSIGYSAFYGCKGLIGPLTIPNSVKIINSLAFAGCNGLTGQLILPNSIQIIGDRAFNSCRGFTGPLTIPNSVHLIDDYAFYQCSGFTGPLTIPNSVQTIGESAFEGCEGLTGSLTIPSSVKSIGHNAFMLCRGLTGLTIPNSVRSIGDLAFSFCQKIEKVYSMIENPFIIPNKVFYKISSNAILYVPKGSKSRYQSIEGWTKYFKEIVEDESCSPTTYTFSISSTGNGSVKYDGTTIRNEKSSFSVNEGVSVTISFEPDYGYRVKSVKVNSSDVTSNAVNNQYTISNITKNTTVEIEFEAIPVTTYTLTITVSGSGLASYSGSTIRNRTSLFSVTEGSSIIVNLIPDNGYKIKNVTENGNTVTSNVAENTYTINSVTKDVAIEVSFEEDIRNFTTGSVSYSVSSQDQKTVVVNSGNFGQVMEIPANVTYQNIVWRVTGIENSVVANNKNLAAVVWNPEIPFTASIDNPNLLLYVKSASYAPSNIQNVVVNGVADNIVLADAVSGNVFYCPQEFTARKISYTHHYGMSTGIDESRGWESIALPFDVQRIEHASKGEIVPFAQWSSGSAKKPFWLMSLTAGGFAAASSIMANTPYIISMPNHPYYKNEYRLNGTVTFSAENVRVKASNSIESGSCNGRTLLPSFTNLSITNALVLNVNNDYVTYSGGAAEGSQFIMGLRPLHPFEAYMLTQNNSRSVNISDGMATGIQEISEMVDYDKVIRVYSLGGQLILTEANKKLEEIEHLLQPGVYIVNGKKLIIK